MQVKTQEILSILSTLRGTVAPKGLNPTYRNVAFSNGYAWSFDGECALIRQCPRELSMLVDADELASCLSKYDVDELDIDTSDGHLVIRSGRSTTKLRSSDPQLFPEIFPNNYVPFCAAKNITEVVGQVLNLLDRDSNLSQVGFHGKYVYATDGRRTSRFALDTPADRRAVAISCKAAKAFVSQGQPINVLATDSQLVGHFEHALFVAAFHHAKVPFTAIDRIADEPAQPANVKMLPVAFDRALERAAGISSSMVVLESTGTELTVRAMTKDVGAFEETFEWQFGKFVIGVNPVHVRAALKFSTSIDWTSVLTPSPRVMRFVLPNADHFVGLMEL